MRERAREQVSALPQIHSFTVQMPEMARAGLVKARTHSRSLMCLSGAQLPELSILLAKVHADRNLESGAGARIGDR